MNPIQNSLDAKRAGQTVRVRFVFSGTDHALPPQDAEPYLANLREHIEAVSRAQETMRGTNPPSGSTDGTAVYEALHSLSKPMTYLVVEDFGTTGLTGNIFANSEQEAENSFWGFFRSSGISPKGEDSGGSWGLGKWVFPDASAVNAYLGLTQRHGDSRWLLMGMALLKTHRIGKDKFRYYGSFAAASKENDDKWLPLPVDSEMNPDFIEQTVHDFKLDRFEKPGEDPGLSVLVPYPKKELTPPTLASAVVAHCFLPIV